MADRNAIADRVDALRRAEREELANRVERLRSQEDERSLFAAINQHPLVQRLGELGSGFTRGAAQVADLPGRAVTGLLPGVEAPEGGFFEAGAERLGMTTPPADATGEAIQTVGENVGASALPTGALLQAGRNILSRGAMEVFQRTGSLREALRLTAQQAATGAARAPGSFVAAETAAATGAGAGQATAEQAFPDNQLASQAGQVIGAFGPQGLAILARGVLGGETLRGTVQAFEAAGTTPTLGEARQSPTLQTIESLLPNVPGGGRIARRAAQQDDEISARIQRTVDNLATRSSPEDAGRAIEAGIERGFLGSFRATASGLYQKVDNLLPGNRQVSIDNTKSMLDELTGPVQGAEELSGVLANNRVMQIRQALDQTGGRLPYSALRDLRSHIGQKLASTALVDDVPRGELKRLYAAISSDLETAARAEGPAAERAFKRANDFYQAGIKRVDDVLQAIVDKADPADIFRAATRSGFAARGTMKSLAHNERSVVTAAVLQRMGRATPGNQDELGEVFSPETYLTNWNKLTPEAKRALFDWERYQGLRQNLDKVAEATAVLREARRRGRNTSGTGQVVAHLSTYGMLLSGVFRGEITTAATGAAAIAGANASARLMTSPRFVKWLAEGTRLRPEGVPQHLARLTALAEEDDSDPEFQAAVGSYLRRLSEAMSD